MPASEVSVMPNLVYRSPVLETQMLMSTFEVQIHEQKPLALMHAFEVLAI
jgi:hypothetical protein